MPNKTATFAVPAMIAAALSTGRGELLRIEAKQTADMIRSDEKYMDGVLEVLAQLVDEKQSLDEKTWELRQMLRHFELDLRGMETKINKMREVFESMRKEVAS